MTSHSTGHYLLEGLMDLDTDYLFSNFGTDHATIIEELAVWAQQGRKAPLPILCPHENVAIHMAGGYAMATGKGQTVLVHVDAGTANASMGMHNLARTRVPVMLMAGKAPHTLRGELPGSRDNFVHFVQDPFDMASVVRPYVKWEYNLPTGVVVKEALRRAHSVMHSDPQGPVFMTLPRETLAEDWDEDKVRSFPATRFGAVESGALTHDVAVSIAQDLMNAQRPVIVTSYVGRKPEAAVLLEELAMLCGIRVAEFGPNYLNISRLSPCFAGFDTGSVIKGADVGLLLDVDVPWLPKYTPHADDTRWLQIDVDAIKKDFPMWGFPVDVRAQADSVTALRQILDVVHAKSDAAFVARVQARVAGWKDLNDKRQATLSAQAKDMGESDALSADYVCATLGQKLKASDIVVNESIRSAFSVLNHIPRSQPGTYFASAGGGLGFSGGAALGIQLARPDARVIQIVGDGVFHFSSPDAVYSVAQSYGLPIFTIVLDNRGWQAVKEAVLRVYPKGAAHETSQFQARLDGEKQGTQRRFEAVGQAFGAHGERVEHAQDLSAALDRCLEAIGRGQAAVLTVRIKPL